MSEQPGTPRPPWYQRAAPSLLVLLGLLLVAVGGTAVLAGNLADVLPEVGKDAQGQEPWEDPIGVEPFGPLQIGRVPDCASAPIERIVLWDEASEPYWEVSGPATVMNTFVIGEAPAGFTVETPYRTPPAGAVLRLGVVRSRKGMAGVRYVAEDLRAELVATGTPTRRYELETFLRGDLCGDGEGNDSSTTVAAGDPSATTDPAGGTPEAGATGPTG